MRFRRARAAFARRSAGHPRPVVDVKVRKRHGPAGLRQNDIYVILKNVRQRIAPCDTGPALDRRVRRLWGRDAARFLFARGHRPRLSSRRRRFPAQTAAAAKPNIVYIVADDLGWKDVGFHGSDIGTPNLDELAKEGVQFGQFYAQPMCTPTRAR